MAYLPDEHDIRGMLDFLGYRDLESFVKDTLPKKYLQGFEVNIPRFDDEVSLLKFFRELSEKNRVFPPENVYIGFGVEPVYVPAVVKYLVSRGEFLTSYTPYQSEMSQGVLQALYEYQSVMAELLDMPIVNSSMYDGASAIAEALLLSERVNKKGSVLIPQDMFINYRKVIETYLEGPGIDIIYYPLPWKDEEGFYEVLYQSLRKGVSGVYFEFPDFYGYLYPNIHEVSDIVHKYNSLFIVGFDVWSLPIIIPPGRFGADVAVGEGQPFGLYQGYGGPLLGIFSVNDDFKIIRNMPGRLIGETVTYDGEKAYTLILQTREQHIRREKATSNICTNEALTAIQTLIYLLCLGKNGLYKHSLNMLKLAHLLEQHLKKLDNISGVSTFPFHRRFTVEFTNVDSKLVYSKMRKKGYLAGYPIENTRLIIHINTFHDEVSVNRFLNEIKEVLSNA